MTKKSNYLSIVKHYENCFDKHGDNFRGVDWPKEGDVNTRYKVMLDLLKYDDSKPAKPSLLDFGCGLAHFYDYIASQAADVTYSGLDISEKFIAQCQKKHPDKTFYCADILDSGATLPDFDYIVMNGVFTEKRELSYDDMLVYFTELLSAAFNKCKRGLAFNVMSKLVEWEREDLFHLPFDTLGKIVSEKLNRSFVIRHDYGLFEYSVYIYKTPNSVKK